MTVVDLYTIQIIATDIANTLVYPYERLNPDALMPEMEENLTDLLPAGYRARIRRWDDITDEPTQEDDDE